ncbi:hypothetical protein RW64_17185 [Geobacter sulfurreducens]|nr:hypothetical protein RW64_17185 [Geobacter sulfurreducens]
MMPKKQPLSILIIDDNTDFVQSLQRQANPYCIQLEHVTNLEDGEKIITLKGEKAFGGIILDRCCYQDSFMQNLRDILTIGTLSLAKKAKSLPIVILTGEKGFEDVKNQFYGVYPVFSKDTTDIDSMLSCIVEESSRLNHIKYSREYPDVFYTIDQYILPKLKNNVRDDLVFALDALLSTDITELSAGLNRLRCIVESILFSINNFDKSIIPDEKVRNYKGNEEVKFGDTMKHLTLTGRLVQYGIIDQSLWRVYKTASKYGAHPDLAKEDFFSSYSYRAIVYQTLDIFLWYRALREGVI